MASLMLIERKCFYNILYKMIPNFETNIINNKYSTNSDVQTEEEEFRKLELIKKSTRFKQQRSITKSEVSPPRYKRLPVDEPWSNVWPAARTFSPSVVPLPLRQSYVEKGSPVGKFCNTELMKIPNFLHLTPPAIKKHCDAIRKFCTEWPKALDTDEQCEKHFPIEFITNDYLHASPTVRDPRARIVTLTIKLSSLTLDYHARDKLLRLVGERYNPKTDLLTLVAERCPLKQQNRDYLTYLLTALFHESWKVEPWESEKTEDDMEKYFWEGSLSQQKIVDLVSYLKEHNKNQDSKEISYLNNLPENYAKTDILNLEEVKEYGEAISDLRNEVEDDVTIKRYKEVILKLLNKKPKSSDSDREKVFA